MAVALSEHCRILPSPGPSLSGPDDLGYFSARYKSLKYLKIFLLRAAQVVNFVGAASGTERQIVDGNVRPNIFSTGKAIRDRKSFENLKLSSFG